MFRTRFFLALPLVFALTACGDQQGEPLEPSTELDTELPSDPLPTDVTPEAEQPTEPEQAEEPTEPEQPEPAEEPAEPTEPTEPTEPEQPVQPAVCGNGALEDGEVCDGADLGDLNCRSFGFGGGSLSCEAQCNGTRTGQCSPLTYHPLAEVGQGLNFQGALNDDDPRWSRPNAACEPGTQDGHKFDSWGIVNDTAAPQRIVVNAHFGDGDGYLHAFGVPFNPQTLEGCMVGNDDLGGINSSGFAEMVLAPNQRMILVVSSYSASASIDAYTLDVITEPETAEPTEPTEPEDPVLDDPVTGDDPTAPASPTCGNGVLEQGEVCDGGDLGDMSCSAMGYSFGVVVCANDCDFFISFCAGDGGEPTDPTDPVDPTDPDPIDPLPYGDPAPVAPIGQVQQLVGSLDSSDATHQRVDQSCSAKTSGGYHYDVLPIVNETGAPQHLQLTGNFDEDGFLAVYTEDFSDEAPGLGCLDADDDFAANDRAGAARSGARIDDLVIYDGEVLYVVVSSFSTGVALGDYSVDVKTVSGDEGPNAALIDDANRSTVLTQGTLHHNDALFDADNKTRYFDSHVVENTSSKTLNLDVLATWQQGDGYLYVYLLSDTAEHGLGQLIAHDDDYNGTSASRIAPEDLFILPGEKLVVVATSFAEDQAIGMYDLSITSAE